MLGAEAVLEVHACKVLRLFLRLGVGLTACSQILEDTIHHPVECLSRLSLDVGVEGLIE